MNRFRTSFPRRAIPTPNRCTTAWSAALGTVLLLFNGSNLAAGQLISATKVIVVGNHHASVASDSGSELTAIGGTRAKAIGGTRAKAIGDTRAKAIGGTRAKAIGGTRAKAIGGTRAKAIGGTRLLAVADTNVQKIATARPADAVNDINAATAFESSPISFMGEKYNWIVIGPLNNLEQRRASVLGYALDFNDENTLQSLFNDQKMVVIANRHSDGEVISLETSDTFISGVTQVVAAAHVESIDISNGTLILSSGVTVDYTELLSHTSQLTVNQGDFVFVQGHLY